MVTLKRKMNVEIPYGKEESPGYLEIVRGLESLCFKHKFDPVWVWWTPLCMVDPLYFTL